MDDLTSALFQSPLDIKPFQLELEKKNEGFKTSAQIQYVCKAGCLTTKGLPYTGALKALKVSMGYEYLWTNIRVKGGAYGCMSNFGRTGDSYFVSYRDPNLEKTLEIYNHAIEYLEKFECSERELTKFIIGTISDMDIPLTPSAKGARGLAAYLSKLTLAEIQQERDQIFNVTQEDIRALKEYVKAILEDDCICVVGNEEKIEKQKNLVLEVDNLFHS